MEPQTPRFAKAILRKKKKAGGVFLPDFKQYCRVTVIKQLGIGTKADIQINGTENSSKINPHTCSQLIYDKGHNIHRTNQVF